jgi:hypothetical protein
MIGLNAFEHLISRPLKDWWITEHKGAVENSLGTKSWNDWFQSILET